MAQTITLPKAMLGHLLRLAEATCDSLEADKHLSQTALIEVQLLHQLHIVQKHIGGNASGTQTRAKLDGWFTSEGAGGKGHFYTDGSPSCGTRAPGRASTLGSPWASSSRVPGALPSSKAITFADTAPRAAFRTVGAGAAR